MLNPFKNVERGSVDVGEPKLGTDGMRLAVKFATRGRGCRGARKGEWGVE